MVHNKCTLQCQQGCTAHSGGVQCVESIKNINQLLKPVADKSYDIPVFKNNNDNNQHYKVPFARGYKALLLIITVSGKSSVIYSCMIDNAWSKFVDAPCS